MQFPTIVALIALLICEIVIYGNHGNEHCMTYIGADYNGTVSITASGISCQNWSSDSPHSHSYHEYDANYCRNTRGDEPMPWCYTIDPDVRWEFCDILPCNVMTTTDCKKTILGTEYSGTVSVTAYGLTCQNWSSDSPHSHNKNEFEANYCRNTYNEDPLPWCYTIDPDVRWQFCTIPLCVSSTIYPEVTPEITINNTDVVDISSISTETTRNDTDTVEISNTAERSYSITYVRNSSEIPSIASFERNLTNLFHNFTGNISAAYSKASLPIVCTLSESMMFLLFICLCKSLPFGVYGH